MINDRDNSDFSLVCASVADDPMILLYCCCTVALTCLEKGIVIIYEVFFSLSYEKLQGTIWKLTEL